MWPTLYLLAQAVKGTVVSDHYSRGTMVCSSQTQGFQSQLYVQSIYRNQNHQITDVLGIS